MVDTHKSREVATYEWAAVRAMIEVHGYNQVLALKIRIGSRVVAKKAPDDIFTIRAIGMDDTGDVIYYDINYDNTMRPYFEDELEVVT
jgi:hypothetical protein